MSDKKLNKGTPVKKNKIKMLDFDDGLIFYCLFEKNISIIALQQPIKLQLIV